ncbi:MAG TPA: BMC domain-containing protein [Bacteroidota bacterium]|nr:BMC domain-containing protein [Bacteroidota bacterium]
MNDALGIIETQGFTPAVQAADAAVKAANVKLARWVKVGGGRVSIVVRGDVAAVKAAVESGVQAARAIGTVHTEVIIPRPSEKLQPKFPLDPMKAEKKAGR